MHWNGRQASQVRMRLVGSFSDWNDREILKMTKRYNILTRCLAALALMFVYVISTSAVLVGTSTTQAEARGRGGGRGGGWGRVICPY